MTDNPTRIDPKRLEEILQIAPFHPFILCMRRFFVRPLAAGIFAIIISVFLPIGRIPGFFELLRGGLVFLCGFSTLGGCFCSI